MQVEHSRAIENARPGAAASAEHVVVQAKLTIGAVDDLLEVEADAVAERVMRMPEPGLVQRACAECEKEEAEGVVRRKPVFASIAGSGATQASSGHSLNIDPSSLASGGSPLPMPARSFMESRFGADFSDVRIHADERAASAASQLRAQAFTIGRDVYFNAGRYSPDSGTGRRLLAHELTHVIQQTSASTVAGLGVARRHNETHFDASQKRSICPGEPAFQVQRLPAPMIQRAEVDDRPANCLLPDGNPLVDSRDSINGWIAAAVNTANRVQIDAAGQVYQSLGSGGSTNKSERLLAALPPNQVRRIEFSRSRYAGTSLWRQDPLTQGILTIAGKVFVAPVINLCGVCIGTDKIGHFFQQGYEYYRLAQEVRVRVDRMSPEEKNELYARLTETPFENARQPDLGEGNTGTFQIEFSSQALTDAIADAYTHEFGNWLEGFDHKLSQSDVRWIKHLSFIPFYYGEGVYGRESTGVLSRADLQANRQGYAFYRDVFHDPSHAPDICGYVGALWNERSELNTFAPRLGTPTGPASSSTVAEEP